MFHWQLPVKLKQMAPIHIEIDHTAIIPTKKSIDVVHGHGHHRHHDINEKPATVTMQ